MPRLRMRALTACLAVWLVSTGTSGPAGSAPSAPPPPLVPAASASLPRACAYLWAKQGADGGWHSETYGLMRSGQALTPFVLHALLLAADACAAPPGGVERALAFLRRHVSDTGQMGVADPDLLEYPNYATAHTLRCLLRAGAAGDHVLIKKMSARLVREQYARANGFTEASPAFGGWGFGGAQPPGRTGHMDLSHTRKVLQALREAGTEDAAVFARALLFLRLMQRHPSETRPHPTPLSEVACPPRGVRFDGGFFFSPVVLDANKGAVLADAHGAFHGSYATATADGLLALLAAGVPRGDDRVRAARGWLLGHEALDHPDGVPRDGPQAWGQAIDFYHLAVRAEAYAALDLSARLTSRMPRVLGPRQRADGSFANERNHLMKEDDPLLATALAVIALRPSHSAEKSTYSYQDGWRRPRPDPTALARGTRRGDPVGKLAPSQRRRAAP